MVETKYKKRREERERIRTQHVNEEVASVVTKKKVKSGYEEICEQWELHHDD